LDAETAARAARETWPADKRHLWLWVNRFTGISLADQAVCKGHSAPFDLFARHVLEPPPLELWHGPRGSGKSFNSAIGTHAHSRWKPGLRTKVLGGSLAQSEQTYRAIEEGVRKGRGILGSDGDTIKSITRRQTEYHNGSEVETLAASETQTRGPHVPHLKLDEVDVMKATIRDDAIGITQELKGEPSAILMTSTWHKVGGPMTELMDRGLAGAFPVSSYCVFEVLERCPDDLSGPNLERCQACPIMRWCHEDRDSHPSGLPKAKRSRGHYRVRDLLTKLSGVSPHIFESDYLCRKPRAEKVWFSEFDRTKHASRPIKFDPRYLVHVAIDPGVHTGAVFFQMVPRLKSPKKKVRVIGDYFAEGLSARANAKAIKGRFLGVTSSDIRGHRVSMDRTAGDRNAVGPLVSGEYISEDCRGRNGIESWIQSPGSVKDTLELLGMMLESADGEVCLEIDPGCLWLIKALENYERKKVGSQWTDDPVDEQHPWEDLIDPLRCGLKVEMPEGHAKQPVTRSVHASRLY
jgi:hypothetical protein